MLKDKNDKLVQILMAILALTLSLLHYYIPPFTILITASLCVIFALTLVFIYRNLYYREYEIFSFRTFFISLLLYLALEELYIRIEWRNRRSFGELVVKEVLTNLNFISKAINYIIKDQYAIDEFLDLEYRHNVNEYYEEPLILSNNSGIQDTLVVYTDNKMEYEYSKSIIVSTSIMTITAYCIAKPILFGIVFNRMFFMFLKQKNELLNCLLTGCQTNGLIHFLLFMLNAVLSVYLWNILTEGDSHLFCFRYLTQVIAAVLLNVYMDISGGTLAPIALKITSNIYLFFRIAIRYVCASR